MEKLPTDVMKYLLDDLAIYYHHLVQVSKKWKMIIISLIEKSPIETPTECIWRKYIGHFNHLHKNKLNITELKYCKHLLRVLVEEEDLSHKAFEWACGFDYCPIIFRLMGGRSVDFIQAILVAFDKNCYSVAFLLSTKIDEDLFFRYAFDASDKICRHENTKMVNLYSSICSDTGHYLIKSAISNKNIKILSYILENSNITMSWIEYHIDYAYRIEFMKGFELLLSIFCRTVDMSRFMNYFDCYLQKIFKDLTRQQQFKTKIMDVASIIKKHPEIAAKLLLQPKKNDHDWYILIKHLTDNNLDESFIWFASHGYVDDVKSMINLGVDIHQDNEHALRYSARNGHYDIVKLLLSYDCDVSVINYYPIRLAIKGRRTDIVSLLAQHVGVIGNRTINVDHSMKLDKIAWNHVIKN